MLLQQTGRGTTCAAHQRDLTIARLAQQIHHAHQMTVADALVGPHVNAGARIPVGQARQGQAVLPVSAAETIGGTV